MQSASRTKYANYALISAPANGAYWLYILVASPVRWRGCVWDNFLVPRLLDSFAVLCHLENGGNSGGDAKNYCEIFAAANSLGAGGFNYEQSGGGSWSSVVGFCSFLCMSIKRAQSRDLMIFLCHSEFCLPLLLLSLSWVRPEKSICQVEQQPQLESQVSSLAVCPPVCDSKPACPSIIVAKRQWRRQKQWIIEANKLWLAEKENSNQKRGMKILICAGNRANDELLSTKACNEMHGISIVNEQSMRYENNNNMIIKNRIWWMFLNKIIIFSYVSKFILKGLNLALYLKSNKEYFFIWKLN